VEALTGLKMSVGTVSQAEERLSEVLSKAYEEGQAAVRQAPQINCDETGGRREGKRSWLWLATSSVLAVFLVSPSRGAKALFELLGDGFLGFVTSDRWHTYNRFATKLRQLCWAHLLRDFQKIAERKGESERIGKALIQLALDMFERWGNYKDGKLSREQLQAELLPIRADIERLLSEGTRLEKAPKTAETCKNLMKVKEALWTFAEHEGIEPTNNRAERLIRNAVLWRNRSLGTWSDRGDRYVERMLTVIISLRLQNRPVLPWLKAAIRAHHGDGTYPSILPAA
jgi:transposase